jgi:hypothetical protein
MKAAELGLSPTAALPHAWGILMETEHSGSVASLAVFAEGTSSLYFSTGGGVLGSGKRENVRDASRTFLASAESNLARLSAATATPLPETGTVRFQVRLSTGQAGGAEQPADTQRQIESVANGIETLRRLTTQRTIASSG